MNLNQALAITKDHIRIGKGMGLTIRGPEALEMVVNELAVTQKALTLACKEFDERMECCPASYCDKVDPLPRCKTADCELEPFSSCWRDYFLAQAKGR